MGFCAETYRLVKQIPKGRVSTYGAVARALGRKNAARAVGNAMKVNPTPVAVPCHRVVCADGRVGGYSRGVKKKIMLLKKEGVMTKNGRIVDFKKVFYPFERTRSYK